MSRDEEVQYEQDNLGNERKKLDTIRAQEGMDAESDEGLTQIQTAQTGTDLLLFSKPTHADRFHIDTIHAYNSQGTANAFSLFEATLNSTGSITSTTRRTTPINVGASEDTQVGYSGNEFTQAVAVNSDFGGWVGIGVIVDHEEYSEPQSEQTS